MDDDDITRNRHRDNPRSIEARPGEQQRARDRARIVDHLFVMRRTGATCWEIAVDLRMPYQTVSGRLSELKRDGIVVCDSTDAKNGIQRVHLIGQRRTATGSNADVCVLERFAPAPIVEPPPAVAARARRSSGGFFE